MLLQRKCACGAPTASLTGECAQCKSKKRLQTKLAIGASHDPMEREAERVADQVMAAPARFPVNATPPCIQRQSERASDEPGMAPASVDRILATSGKPLEIQTRRDLEPRFGHDFSQVRVHTDGDAGNTARAVKARAYTFGGHIVFGDGQYAPATASGKRLLAHELVHVVQQGAATPMPSQPANQRISEDTGLPAIPHAVGQAPIQRTPEPTGPTLSIRQHSTSVSGVIFRSESDHPEEEHCKDVSEQSTSCAAIIECIEELIEQLAGRFADIENKGGDAGHMQRIKIVQTILKTLMTLARTNCKNGEYDEELEKEAEKWANRQGRSVQEPVAEASFREKIAAALKKAGIPAWAVAGFVVLVIAAIADPEPFSKIALIIGVAAALVVFIAIGRQSDVPPGA
ncbi:MAG: DUF4157 domain-containing protein [Polaromonas sp.]